MRNWWHSYLNLNNRLKFCYLDASHEQKTIWRCIDYLNTGLVQYSDPHWSWFLRTCTTCPSWPRTLRLSCSLSAVSSPIVFWKGLTSLRLGFKTDYLVNPIILQKGLLFYFNWNILEKLCYKMTNRFYLFWLTKNISKFWFKIGYTL